MEAGAGQPPKEGFIMTDKTEPPPTQSYIFRPWITKPDGTVIYAKAYGKKAFKIPVPSNDNQERKAV